MSPFENEIGITLARVYIGTCSWKYPSWQGLVYSAPTGIDYLQEYAKKYNTVEIDQWFWSLFDEKTVKMPIASDVASYRQAVSDDFRFTIKAPNSLTLTHFYQKKKDGPLTTNPFFLSPNLWRRFLDAIAPLEDVMGPLLMQFEYLNRKKMTSQNDFQQCLTVFKKSISEKRTLGVEIRNGNYLNSEFFSFINKNRFIPVLLQGYWMPPIADVYEKHRVLINESPVVVIRLHGPDRESVEKETSSIWNRIVNDREQELAGIGQICKEVIATGREVYVNVNNHYEGSAPLTIQRLNKYL